MIEAFTGLDCVELINDELGVGFCGLATKMIETLMHYYEEYDENYTWHNGEWHNAEWWGFMVSRYMDEMTAIAFSGSGVAFEQNKKLYCD